MRTCGLSHQIKGPTTVKLAKTGFNCKIVKFTITGPLIWCDNPQVRMSKILYINNNNFHHLGRSQMCAGGCYVFRTSKPLSGTLWEYIYSGGFWDSKACAVCARWDRSGAAAPNSAPKIVWQFLEPSLVLLQQSTDQSEKSCEDNLPVSSNISKPNSAPKRCDRIGSASVATCTVNTINIVN